MPVETRSAHIGIERRWHSRLWRDRGRPIAADAGEPVRRLCIENCVSADFRRDSHPGRLFSIPENFSAVQRMVFLPIGSAFGWSMTVAIPDANGRMGERLRSMRKLASLTLTDASKMSGVSISTLSKIENGLVSPSFDIIKKICDGLDVSIEEFVRPGSTIQVSGRKTVTTAKDGVRFTSGQYDYRAHATELSRKGMVPLEIRVRARSVDEFDHWSRHRGEEFVYVLSGSIEVHTEFYEPFRLNAGESGYFDSSMAHVYVTTSEEDAFVLSVSYDPEQGRGKITDLMHPSAEPIAESETGGRRRRMG